MLRSIYERHKHNHYHPTQDNDQDGEQVPHESSIQ